MIIQVAGRLGRDPETRFTPSGTKVTTLTLATNVRKGGKEETVWWRITIWGDRFDKMLPHLKKGSAIIAVGEMNKPEIWTDKEGRPQVSLELTAGILQFSPFGNPERNQEQGQANAYQASPAGQSHSSYGSAGGFESFGTPSSYSGAPAGHSPYSPGKVAGGNSYIESLEAEDPLPF